MTRLPRPGTSRHQRRLAATAGRLVAARWPVVPGAWWSRERARHHCDLPGCLTVAVHPAPIACHEGMVCVGGWPDLTRYALTTAGDVATRWLHRPYAVLVVTGVMCDVVDAPASVADRLVHHLHRAGRSALAARVDNRGLVFLAAGRAVDTHRALTWARHGVVFHQRNSWVALPPSIVGDEPAWWITKPRRTGPLPLPPADAVLPVLDRLCPPSPPPARGVVPMRPGGDATRDLARFVRPYVAHHTLAGGGADPLRGPTPAGRPRRSC